MKVTASNSIFRLFGPHQIYGVNGSIEYSWMMRFLKVFILQAFELGKLKSIRFKISRMYENMKILSVICLSLVWWVWSRNHTKLKLVILLAELLPQYCQNLYRSDMTFQLRPFLKFPRYFGGREVTTVGHFINSPKNKLIYLRRPCSTHLTETEQSIIWEINNQGFLD